mmetsp:Transcript_95997/g.220081  ORF Transcript_95997/g.220081 Transcript_95997/m.220081 type:complete len:354 (+) Transcript_95997:417-1478(+)
MGKWPPSSTTPAARYSCSTPRWTTALSRASTTSGRSRDSRASWRRWNRCQLSAAAGMEAQVWGGVGSQSLSSESLPRQNAIGFRSSQACRCSCRRTLSSLVTTQNVRYSHMGIGTAPGTSRCLVWHSTGTTASPSSSTTSECPSTKYTSGSTACSLITCKARFKASAFRLLPVVSKTQWRMRLFSMENQQWCRGGARGRGAGAVRVQTWWSDQKILSRAQVPVRAGVVMVRPRTRAVSVPPGLSRVTSVPETRVTCTTRPASSRYSPCQYPSTRPVANSLSAALLTNTLLSGSIQCSRDCSAASLIHSAPGPAKRPCTVGKQHVAYLEVVSSGDPWDTSVMRYSGAAPQQAAT